MHERTMRAVARWLFLVSCAGPTLLTLLTIVITATPMYRRVQLDRLQRELTLRTGLLIEIDDCETVSPSDTLLHNVRLADPETKATVGTIRVVQFLRDDHETILRLSQPEFQSRQLGRLWRLLHDRILSVPAQTESPWRLTAADLTLRSGSQSITLRDVAGWLQPTATSISTVLQCLPADSPPGSEPLAIQIERHRDGDQPRTAWSLQTNGRDVTVSWLADYVPQLKLLGGDATFNGQLVISEIPTSERPATLPSARSGRWSIDLSGSTIDDIDLSKVGESLPHGWSGRGRLELDGFRLEDGGLVDAFGSLHATEGQLSASLIRGLQSHLQMLAPETLQPTVAYDRIALRFEMYASQLRINGICQRQRGLETLPPATVATVAGQPLIRSVDAVMPTTRLAGLLAPSHSVMVPLADQTRGLLSILRAPRSAMPLADPTIPSIPGTQLTQGVDADNPPTARISRLRSEPRR